MNDQGASGVPPDCQATKMLTVRDFAEAISGVLSRRGAESSILDHPGVPAFAVVVGRASAATEADLADLTYLAIVETRQDDGELGFVIGGNVSLAGDPQSLPPKPVPGLACEIAQAGAEWADALLCSLGHPEANTYLEILAGVGL